MFDYLYIIKTQTKKYIKINQKPQLKTKYKIYF